MSLKMRTFLMSGIIICLFMVVGGVGYYAVKSLRGSVSTLSKQSLPAVRNMTLVDMMHDGIRAVVYRSMVAKPEEHSEIKDEFKDFSDNIKKYLSEIKHLGLSEELNASIADADVTINQFLKDADVVINLSLGGDKAQAEAALPAFAKSFNHVGEDLAKIGDTIQERATFDSNQSLESANWFSHFTLYLVAFGVLVSCGMSFLAYKFMSGLTTGLLGITKGLKDEAQTIVITSQQMAEVSSKLSEATTEQAASLQETVSSIDEISAMVSRNADSAMSSSQMSDNSTRLAQKGKEKAVVMMNSINAIAQGNDEIIGQMQRSNEEISEIVKVIQNISTKTQVINDIVFQTKLLSFNASVEAARAGEHGKGFAVVAEEVGNLASMSGKAANEITDMLTNSVKKVTDIVDNTKNLMENLIKQSKEKVEFGSMTAKECSLALEEILANVSSMNSIVSEIATASKEQSSGVSEVNKAMTELDQVTQNNSIIAQDSAKAASTLEDQATRLNTLVTELTRIVGGKNDASEVPVKPKKDQVHVNNVIPLVKPVPKEVTHTKRAVAGLDTAIPASDDSRFEDA